MVGLPATCEGSHALIGAVAEGGEHYSNATSELARCPIPLGMAETGRYLRFAWRRGHRACRSVAVTRVTASTVRRSVDRRDNGPSCAAEQPEA